MKIELMPVDQVLPYARNPRISDTWRRMLTHAYRFTNKQLQPIK